MLFHYGEKLKILSSLSHCHMIAQMPYSHYFIQIIRAILSFLEAFLYVHATYIGKK